MASEITQLRRAVERSSAEIARHTKALESRDTRIAELERLLEESRRSVKRQAAPLSKSDPIEEPARSGRRRGYAHERHGHRMAPAVIDREVHVPVPDACPDCGVDLITEPIVDQLQFDLPDPRPVGARFRVPVARCGCCGERVQGRHLEQASDALEAVSA